MRAARLLLSLGLVLLTACDATPPPTGSGRPSPSPGRSSPSSPAAPGDCESSRGGVQGANRRLTAVRTGTHSTFDRVTFEFAEGEGAAGVPAFEINRVTPPPRYDGSGEPMEMSGESFVQIVFHGATGVVPDGETFRQTWIGDKEMKTGYPALVELEQAGDFEATLSWVAGISSADACWKAAELGDPVRMVWDFPHHG